MKKKKPARFVFLCLVTPTEAVIYSLNLLFLFYLTAYSNQVKTMVPPSTLAAYFWKVRTGLLI